jgi:hypothetical protein
MMAAKAAAHARSACMGASKTGRAGIAMTSLHPNFMVLAALQHCRILMCGKTTALLTKRSSRYCIVQGQTAAL